MTCLTGFFHDVYTESLAEALLKAPSGGAVAVWASSGLTFPDAQDGMNREVLSALTRGRRITLGEATLAAKAAAGDPDVRRTWILLGDPAMFLRDWRGCSGGPESPCEDVPPVAPEACPGGRCTDPGCRFGGCATDYECADDACAPTGGGRDGGDTATDGDADGLLDGTGGAVPPGRREVPTEEGGGCACRAGGSGGAPGGATLLTLLVLGPLGTSLRRRRRRSRCGDPESGPTPLR